EQTHRDAEVKAALLREVSHRVKNNLAAITSLLQLAIAESPEKREQILLETLARAQSLVAAHTLLARSNQARINVVELGEQILQDSARTLAPFGSTLSVRASGDPAELVPRQLTTVALILNELATNAITHGLGPPIRDGCLEFKSQRISSGALRLSLSDNGDRLPEELEKLPSPGMGLLLVRTLVEKDLRGSFTIERRSPWTIATIEFEIEA
ncbi:MAG: sensor histidine kinase, partial [Rudaea sp.]